MINKPDESARCINEPKRHHQPLV